MRTRVKLFAGLFVAALALGIPTFLMVPVPEAGRVVDKPVEAYLAEDGKLDSLYQTWKAGYERSGGNRNYLIALGWSRGLSIGHTYASGLARIDMIGGTARVEIDNMGPSEDGWDVWLVDNVDGPQRSTLPESGDLMHRLGRLHKTGSKAVLEARFDGGLFTAFDVDVVAVTPKGLRPDEGTVLNGSPILFQRLYTQASQEQARPRPTARLAYFFGPRVAFADSPFNSTDPLIAEGAELFFNEKFSGNGRTCATCHPAENNFTIDPRFIATLPSNNALFVAEHSPQLANNFEKPILLRELGLVLENADGFEDLPNKFVMRGVPHLLGLSRYLVNGVGDGSTAPPNQRLGWGGDGAPGSGTLRDFATGAVTQHFTKRLDRVPGTDFRLPTDAELDALEAFQLALGRQDNPNISAMTLRNPMANLGRVQHNGLNSRCAVCHVNGGANSPASAPTNRNFDIGVGRLPFHPASAIDPSFTLPPDGGFGTAPSFDPVTGEPRGFGNVNNDIRFNTQAGIESVDTPPFFHNNAVFTIEEAVGYYNSQAFKKSQAGGNLPTLAMETTEVENIAAFLRVMSALENIRASTLLDQAAVEEGNSNTAKELARLASFDTQDGWEVLEQRYLHAKAVAKLKAAYAAELAAAVTNNNALRDGLLSQAMTLKAQARAELVIE